MNNNNEYNAAVSRGMIAWDNGKLLIDNPYTTGTDQHAGWIKGYESAAESHC